MTQPTYQLDEFRFQEDSGSDASPNWVELANTDTTLTVGIANAILLRLQMHNTNTKVGEEAWNYEYSLNSGTWTPITAATNVIRAVTSLIFTEGDDCLNKLTLRSGTFVTDNNGYCTDGGGVTYTHTADYYSETALVFYIPDTVDVDDLDDIEIRIVEASTDTIDYNSLTANITVDKPAPTVTINCAAGTVTATGQTATIDAPVLISPTAAGIVTATGQTAAIEISPRIESGPGVVTSTGQTATILIKPRISTNPGVITAIGQTAAIEVQLVISCNPGVVTSTGLVATIDVPNIVNASAGIVTATGQTVTLDVPNIISSSVGVITATGQQATMATGTVIIASAGTVIATGQQATIGTAVLISANAGVITATGQQASIEINVIIAVQAGTVTATGQQAIIGVESIVLVSTLTIVSLAESLSVSLVTGVLADTLFLASTVPNLIVAPGTATVLMDSGILSSIIVALAVQTITEAEPKKRYGVLKDVRTFSILKKSRVT